MCVTNGIHIGCSLLSQVVTVNCVQTLKASTGTCVTNDAPTVAGLITVVGKLLSLSDGDHKVIYPAPSQREAWVVFNKTIPPVRLCRTFLPPPFELARNMMVRCTRAAYISVRGHRPHTVADDYQFQRGG
jgi:hypothetical protein